MSENDTKRADSLAGMWNDRMAMTIKIEAIINPFCEKYGLDKQQVQIDYGYHGVGIKVIL